MSALQKLPILIKLPTAVLTRYQNQYKVEWANSSLAEYSYLFQGNYLKLMIAPEDYRVVNNYEGDGSRFLNGFNRSIPVVCLLRRTLQIRCKDDRALIRWIVEDVARISNSTSYSGEFIPIELVDYVRPEIEDVAATPQGQRPYTTRYGMIPTASIESGGTWQWRNDYRHQGGFQFEFIESTLRQG